MASINVPLPLPENLPSPLRDSQHWIVWKAELREDKVAKIPCNENGITASMKNGHGSLSTALANANRLRATRGTEMYGVGICFTEDIGFVGVDLDSAIVGGIRAAHLEWALKDFPTWGEVSLSGVGAHLFYLGSFPGKRNAFIDDASFEIFGSKGFIAVTGRVIADSPNEFADFRDIRAALEPHLEKEKVYPAADGLPKGGGDPNSAYGQTALLAQCDRVRNAPDGQLHYTLCSAATSLGRLIPHCLGFDAAESALYEAAEQAGAKDLDNALKTIKGQLEFGMTDPATPRDRFTIFNGDDVDLSEFGVSVDEDEEIEEEKSPTRTDPGLFPKHLLDVPGFINEVSAYTNEKSFVLHPVMALAGALSLLAVLTGRKIADQNGARTNCYIISVASSGEGKESARKTNIDVLTAAGADSLLGTGSWASGAGLLAAVNQSPAVLFNNDEIGRFLQTTSDPKKAPHLFSINSILLKLYSSADSVFLGDAYADVDKRIKIVNPHAVVYGTTVPSALYAAMTEESITGGLMGRMLIFEVDQRDGVLQKPKSQPPPKSILETTRKWATWQPTGGNLASVNPTPFIVPCDDEADCMFDNLRQFSRDQAAIMGDVFGSLWVRCAENARKLALLYACSENFGENARITSKAAQWACELARYLVARQCWMASQFISRNQIELASMTVERLIRSAGSNGIDSTGIIRQTRHISRREREEILIGLIECKLIKKVILKTKGRPRVVYVAA